MKAIATLALLGPWLLAQDPAPLHPSRAEHRGRPQTAARVVVETGRLGIERAFRDPDLVMFDQPQAEGPLWTVGSNFKASFDDRGFTFFGFPQPGAASLQPIRFRLAGVQVGGQPLELRDATPVRSDRRIAWARGGLIETVDVTGRGVEQTFTFAHLPRRGDLVVDIEAATELTGQNLPAGIRFTGDHDEVTYSQAIAIDARGASIATPTMLADGRITIRVPAAFVEQALLPLRIDPWVTAIAAANGTLDLGDPDVAFDVQAGVWGIVFARNLGGGDWDCYVQRVADGNPMHLVGGPVAIDITSAAWQRPRIAGIQMFSEFGIVAQVRSGTAPWQVWSRLIANSGAIVTGQFPVAQSGVDELHPDIGGDPTTEPRAAFFAVVWEHAHSAVDHDIHATQLFPTGGTGNLVIVQGDARNQTFPAISKSAGGGPSGSQRWGIVHQQTQSPGNEDIWGAMMFWNGVLVPVQGSANFPIETSGFNEVLPQVSTPTLPGTDGSRRLLAVYERTNSGAGDIAATCFDQDGVARSRANLSVLEGDAIRLAWPQRRPSVDSDGDRFFVAYHEVFQGNTTANDLDTRIQLVGAAPNELLVEEHVPLANDQDRQFHVRVASRYGATGQRSARACTTHDRDNAAGGFGIDAYTYDGRPVPSFRPRTTGCGTLAITPSGGTMLGNHVAFAISSGVNLGGFVVGLPADVPIAGCSGCRLGVNGSTAFGSSFQVRIPLEPSLVGVQVAVQGFVFAGAGPCLGRVHLSDTVEFVVQ